MEEEMDYESAIRHSIFRPIHRNGENTCKGAEVLSNYIMIFIGGKVWQAIHDQAKSFKGSSLVAVAYFGTKGAELLPLKPGSKLVVDASIESVKFGRTNPAELLKLYKSGVAIYSKPGLHSKIYVFGHTAMIGSPNVSMHSHNHLSEAIYSVTDLKAVGDMKSYIQSLCTIENELGPTKLEGLSKIYRPPHPFVGGGQKISSDIPRLHVWSLYNDDDFSFGYEKALTEAISIANSKLGDSKRFSRTEFEWDGPLSIREDDMIVQIWKDRNKEFVYPPARILSIVPFEKGKKFIVSLEVPNRRTKRLDRLNEDVQVILSRNGRKSRNASITITSIWKER